MVGEGGEKGSLSGQGVGEIWTSAGTSPWVLRNSTSDLPARRSPAGFQCPSWVKWSGGCEFWAWSRKIGRKVEIRDIQADGIWRSTRLGCSGVPVSVLHWFGSAPTASCQRSG